MKLNIESFKVTVNAAVKGDIELSATEGLRKETYNKLDASASVNVELNGLDGQIETEEIKRLFEVINTELKNQFELSIVMGIIL